MEAHTAPLTHRQFLAVTLPLMLSTATQPLLGAVNTAMMGHMEDGRYIAAVALGVILFNSIYWLFGFLRVSTTTFAAQACGRHNSEDSTVALLRPALLALLISAGVWGIYPWLFDYYAAFMNPGDDVVRLMKIYCDWQIWGAPFVLGNYVLLGWLMGQMHVRTNVAIQISTNVLNIVLAVLFVYGWGWNIVGVAAAYLIAQACGCAAGIAAIWRVRASLRLSALVRRQLSRASAYVDIIKVNADLMIRTLCLLAINNLFAQTGSRLGTDVLAANAVLLEIIFIMAYLADGIANGMSVFTGMARGRSDVTLWRRTLTVGLHTAAVYMGLTAIVMALTGDVWIALMTDLSHIMALAHQYRWALIAYPLCAPVGLVLYGMYTGIGETASIRNMMLIAVAVFVLGDLCLTARWGNDGLWLTYVGTYLLESVILTAFLPKARAHFA